MVLLFFFIQLYLFLIMGAMMIPPMVEKGYDRDFSAALTASAGSLGVLIPPSIPMVLYCIAGEDVYKRQVYK